ncbi:hypothetical protein ATANTOWER_006565 [Ataeniobius toweri]|uniref:Uncharacterized protein n=1 Tax=Ataeniobius toweri TaxID=208326 RepID=A0ABU7CF36_9TELE|nr:hypothetical protein [Ataeniobius toweri]
MFYRLEVRVVQKQHVSLFIHSKTSYLSVRDHSPVGKNSFIELSTIGPEAARNIRILTTFNNSGRITCLIGHKPETAGTALSTTRKPSRLLRYSVKARHNKTK